MKKWICAALCLSMTAVLVSVSAPVCAEGVSAGTGSACGQAYGSGLSGNPAAYGDMGDGREMSVKALAAEASGPSAKPTVSPDPATGEPGDATATPAATATPSVETDKMETATPLPPFTGNKVVNDEAVFLTTENSDGKTCTVTGYNGDTGVTTLYIPAQIGKKTVTLVADGVLAKCPFLKNVVVTGDAEFQGPKVFATVQGIEIWGKTGGKANAYAVANGLSFHALEGPAKVSGKRSSGLKTVTLTWDTVNGAVSYNVYRKQGKGKYVLNANMMAVTLVNEGLKPGATYVYQVHPVFTAPNGDAVEGLASKETSVSLVPSKLKKVRAKGIRGGIQVRWGRDKKVDGYQIYMKVHLKSFKTPFKLVKTNKKNKTTGYRSKMLVRGMKYSYKVRSFKKIKGKKIFGPFVTVTTKAK